MTAKIPEPPFLWLTQKLDGLYPWKHFRVEGIMFNAYDFFKKGESTIAMASKGIHSAFDFQGPILMDSGGYSFMYKSDVKVDIEKLVEFYETSKPDLAVVLDHPLLPNLSKKERLRRLRLTLKNTERMVLLKKTSNPVLVPVIHGHDRDTIERMIRKLNRMLDFEIYAIGSLVPSVFNTKGVGGIYNVVKIVKLVKELLPGKRIHVFGVGSSLTMHLMFLAGADYVDSSGWRTKAAFGAIQLPGAGDRYITKRKRRKKYPSLSRKERELVYENIYPSYKGEDYLKDLMRDFRHRALHNAWVLQREVINARELMKEGQYEKYAKKVLSTSKLFRNVLRELRMI